MISVQKDVDYGIELGDTVKNINDHEVQYHSLMYKFKPQSMKDATWEGKLEIDSNNGAASLTVSNAQFKGTYEEKHTKQQSHECVLIFDRHANTFRLERLYASTGGLTRMGPRGKIQQSSSNTEVILPLSDSQQSSQHISPQQTTTQSVGTQSRSTAILLNRPPGGQQMKTKKVSSVETNQVSGQKHSLDFDASPPKKKMTPTTTVSPPKPMGLGVQVDAKAALDSSGSDSGSSSSDSDSDSSDSDSDSSDSSGSSSDSD